MEFTAIIVRIIWRLAPALWLEWAIRGLIHWAIACLNDEQDWLCAHRKNCFWFGGWLAVIEARIDELIDLKAHQLLNRRCEPRDVPAHHPAPAVRSFEDCVLRLARLMWRFEDAERLARCRTRTLQRLMDDPLRLLPRIESGVASTSPAFAVEANAHCLTAVLPPSVEDWGRWLAASSRPDGGGAFAPIRGPPSIGVFIGGIGRRRVRSRFLQCSPIPTAYCPLPTASRAPHEIAIPCLKKKGASGAYRYRHSLRLPSTM